jgi:CheY-like chemotaxis protein
MSIARILVVEDDLVVMKALEFALQAEGYHVTGVLDSTAAMEAVKKQRPDLMILDVSLIMDSGFSGISDGFSLLGWMRYTLGIADIPVIVHTADKSASVDKHARENKAFAVVRKGATHEELIETIRQALAAYPRPLDNDPPEV